MSCTNVKLLHGPFEGINGVALGSQPPVNSLVDLCLFTAMAAERQSHQGVHIVIAHQRAPREPAFNIRAAALALTIAGVTPLPSLAEYAVVSVKEAQHQLCKRMGMRDVPTVVRNFFHKTKHSFNYGILQHANKVRPSFADPHAKEPRCESIFFLLLIKTRITGTNFQSKHIAAL
jgi:hypothetical protein